VGLWRSTRRYRPKEQDDAALRTRLRELAQIRRRFGCPRLHVLLRREGWAINHKRTERLYRQEGLSLRLRKRRKRAAVLRVPLAQPERVNQRWSMDFMQDCLAGGRKIRALTIVDDFSRECPAIEVDTSLGGTRVVRVLDRLAETRGLPEVITVDNGPEFSGKALDAWAYRRGIRLDFIRPGKPVENAFIESFNGRVRDECLRESWFTSLQEAKDGIEAWRVDYNQVRPHGSLGNLTPEEFAAKNQAAVTMTSTQRLNISLDQKKG
jgi:putative transposase